MTNILVYMDNLHVILRIKQGKQPVSKYLSCDYDFKTITQRAL